MQTQNTKTLPFVLAFALAFLAVKAILLGWSHASDTIELLMGVDPNEAEMTEMAEFINANAPIQVDNITRVTSAVAIDDSIQITHEVDMSGFWNEIAAEIEDPVEAAAIIEFLRTSDERPVWIQEVLSMINLNTSCADPNTMKMMEYGTIQRRYISADNAAFLASVDLNFEICASHRPIDFAQWSHEFWESRGHDMTSAAAYY